MKITIDDKFMDWILDQIRGLYCLVHEYENHNCSDCPYYRNRKHVHCEEIPLIERLMITRKLYEKEENNDLQRKEDRTLQVD